MALRNISNLVRLEEELTIKTEELTQIDEELKALKSRRQVLSAEVNSLKKELKFLNENKNSLSSFDSDDFPWSIEMEQKLKSVFNIQKFRSHQKSAINATMSNLDCILIMPTGGGKSLCFQLPAILSTGITLVISPLISLMEDQLQALQSLNIATALLNSQTNKVETKRIFESMIDQTAILKLLYVTPERLAKSKRFMSQLEKMQKLGRLARIVIDEVHCCSSWGHDFRPDYKYLGILKRQFPKIPIIGLTATATTKVTLDIQTMLNIEGCIVFRDSFFRPNLKYEVFDTCQTQDRVEDLSNLIKSRFSGLSGIIYCLTIKDTEEVAAKLKTFKIRCDRYHAQLEPTDRTRIQKEWYSNQIQIIVATVAFGMGINKLNVRFVVHYSISKSLENFYQESGRAGRDGEVAYCILFYQLSDVFRATSMMMAEKNGTKNVYNMLRYCLDRDTCRKALIAEHFGDTWDEGACTEMCDNCDHLLKPKRKLVNVVPLLNDILKILRHGDSIEQRMTIIKLMSAWFGKGDKKLRVDGVKIPTYPKTVCEAVIGKLLLDKYIDEEFHFTPYATISHLVPSTQHVEINAPLNYTLPLVPCTFSAKNFVKKTMNSSFQNDSSVCGEASKKLKIKKKNIERSINEVELHESKLHDGSFSSTTSSHSNGAQTSKFTFKHKVLSDEPKKKKTKMAIDHSTDEDDIFFLN